MIISNFSQGDKMLYCGNYPDWVIDRGLKDEEWVHDRWDD